MPRTRRPAAKEESTFSVHSVTLSADEVTVLDRLSRDASDFLGRPISSSAIIRALIRRIENHGPSAADDLFFEVERELKADVLWGKHKRVNNSLS